jgi:hypothetical protein
MVSSLPYRVAEDFFTHPSVFTEETWQIISLPFMLTMIFFLIRSCIYPLEDLPEIEGRTERVERDGRASEKPPVKNPAIDSLTEVERSVNALRDSIETEINDLKHRNEMLTREVASLVKSVGKSPE